MNEDLTIRVDQTRCVGTGQCARTAPDALTLGRNGRAQPRDQHSTDLDTLTEAADFCPVEAITIHLASTGEQVAPL
ncbi:Putative 3Fe-4S ferredoxin [Kitasatospora sp. MMS16-BH015]|uniref:ferredoxin n=1 Tax=Kitasatospora sp. MMS16-BH015 TaxID=2018025 RepID=UPI000CA3ADC5|nr:ferredoxin [Kitasatospora sp. MMS16-BH015]AUG75118.1 Putative 3Fe-4S ferredoxin [Kitasatospora sp. MMS16-BH015]